MTPDESRGAAGSRRRRAVVLVHGVGSPKPGEFLQEWRAGFSGRSTTWTPSVLIVDGRSYESSSTELPAEVLRMVEVNWSDLRRPLQGLVGVARHLIQLMIAIVGIATASPALDTPRRPIARSYAWILFGLGWWSYLPVLVTMLASCATTLALRVVVVLAGTATMAVLTHWLAKYSADFKAGYFWAIGMLIVDGALVVASRFAGTATQITVTLYVASQVLLALFLAAAMVELFREPKPTRDQKWAHLALLWLPFAIMSGLAAIVWVAALALARSGTLFDVSLFQEWAQQFLHTLHYDLRVVEWTTASAVMLSGFGVALVVWAYFHPPREVPAGKHAQDRLARWLRVPPVLLGVAGVVLIVSLIQHLLVPVSNSSSILTTYAVSLARLGPFLLFLLPGLQQVVDVVGDVAFYLAPDPLSIRADGLRRVRRVVQELADQGHDDLVVVGFSQGSVLARVGLAEAHVLGASLVTVGSPIGSLYARFLGWFPEPSLVDDTSWWNGYHDGDFIAGEIEGSVSNNELGTGAHGAYEREGRVRKVVFWANVVSAG